MRAAGLLIALALMVAAPLHAQGRDKRAASAHFQQGSALYGEGRWSEALAEFEAGYDAYPLRGFLVNIGQCYRKLERLDEAADAWRRFLATRPADARLRAEVEDALAEVESVRAPREPKTADVRAEDTPTAAPAATAAAVSIAELAPVPSEPPSPAENLLTQPVRGDAKPKKSRAWVWALVGVAAASVAAAVVTVGVVEWQASSPHSGSLGLVDGRR